MNVISNTFTSNENSTLHAASYNCTYYPVDKVFEMIEETKKLYERLLTAEKEKVALLEKMLALKK